MEKPCLPLRATICPATLTASIFISCKTAPCCIGGGGSDAKGKRTTVAVDRRLHLPPHASPSPSQLIFWHSPECVLLWAEESESWVLQGRSQPVRLRDCRPRHKSFASGRPREESCAEVGKSILLANVSSESWKSALDRRTAETPELRAVFPSIINNKSY